MRNLALIVIEMGGKKRGKAIKDEKPKKIGKYLGKFV